MGETSVQSFELPAHGGNLFAARQAYPQAPEPWLDLSTGINPYPYPFAHPPPESFARLPEQEAIRALEMAAARAYRTPMTAETIAAPGSQAIINWLPHLVPAKRVGILGFTYCEYAPRWAAAGAKVTMARDLAELEGQDVAIIVNPNNPDGRLVAAADLHALAESLAARGGLLIVDEAFVDFLEPGASAVPGMPEQGMIILRSFGKAYGLPGLRLGFAAGPKALAEKLRAAFGPWPVSGAAITTGSKALLDPAWLADAAMRLMAQGLVLDNILAAAGFAVAGSNALFRLACHNDAQVWFDHLARNGILVRRFKAHPAWLRFGIAGSDTDISRLSHALKK
jgi:cobalamin biosynthesis protein CobC